MDLERPRFRVSDLPTVRYGQEDWIADSVAHYGIGPDADVPMDVDIIRIIHDMSIELDLYAWERDPPNPSGKAIRETFFRPLVEGKQVGGPLSFYPRRNQITGRWNRPHGGTDRRGRAGRPG
ncbi:MAG: hypothetical protein ABEK12_00920 [Candidatus Nanohaloarchaea archaeon]